MAKKQIKKPDAIITLEEVMKLKEDTIKIIDGWINDLLYKKVKSSYSMLNRWNKKGEGTKTRIGIIEKLIRSANDDIVRCKKANFPYELYEQQLEILNRELNELKSK